MSKPIIFSQVFPKYHPQAGKPTHFVEQIYNEIGLKIGITKDSGDIPKSMHHLVNDFILLDGQAKKKHTIRAGYHWKVGDKFSPRIWSSKPYKDKQIIIAPDIEVKKIWTIEIDLDIHRFKINGVQKMSLIDQVAHNDGLSLDDFLDWFNKPFQGQIICWSDDVCY